MLAPLEGAGLSTEHERPWWNTPLVLVVPALALALSLWSDGVSLGLVLLIIAVIVGKLAWTWLFG